MCNRRLVVQERTGIPIPAGSFQKEHAGLSWFRSRRRRRRRMLVDHGADRRRRVTPGRIVQTGTHTHTRRRGTDADLAPNTDAVGSLGAVVDAAAAPPPQIGNIAGHPQPRNVRTRLCRPHHVYLSIVVLLLLHTNRHATKKPIYSRRRCGALRCAAENRFIILMTDWPYALRSSVFSRLLAPRRTADSGLMEAERVRRCRPSAYPTGKGNMQIRGVFHVMHECTQS